MAGSKRKFRYESDSGQAYVLTLDESNGEAVNSTSTRITDNLTGTELNKPARFTPRYVLAYLQSNPLIRRKFTVGDPATVVSLVTGAASLSAPVYANADGTVPTAAVWIVTAYRGEKLAVFSGTAAVDTGLTDGDSPT